MPYFRAKALKKNKKIKTRKKDDVSAKNHLQVPTPNRKYPLTGGAEAHGGALDGQADNKVGNEAEEKFRGI